MRHVWNLNFRMFLHCKNILKFTFKYLRLKKFKHCETYSVNKRIQIKRSCGGLQLMKLSPSSDESWQAVLRVAQSRNGVTFVPVCCGEEKWQYETFLPGRHFRGLTCYCCSNSMTTSSMANSALKRLLLSLVICGFHAGPTLVLSADTIAPPANPVNNISWHALPEY